MRLVGRTGFVATCILQSRRGEFGVATKPAEERGYELAGIAEPPAAHASCLAVGAMLDAVDGEFTSHLLHGGEVGEAQGLRQGAGVLARPRDTL
jgi:hypothetical protein